MIFWINLNYDYIKHTKYLGKALRWVIGSVINHIVDISKYNPLAGSSYIKLRKELDHPKKAWIIFRSLMIKNTLNGIYSDTYILQTIVKE